MATERADRRFSVPGTGVVSAGVGRGRRPSTGTATANLVDAAGAAGADLVLMSTVGAAANSPMELFRMKRAAEEYASASGVPTTVVRATVFAELWVDLLE